MARFEFILNGFVLWVVFSFGEKMPKQIKEGLRGSHIEKLRRKLIKDCYWYYVKSKPLISDRTYDMLFKELEDLEKIPDCVFYPTSYSPTQMIWGDLESQYPTWAKTADLYILYDDEIVTSKRPVLKIPQRPRLGG